MVNISIVDGGYKLTYNWGVPHCRLIRRMRSYETMRRQNGIPGIGRHRINPYRYGLIATLYLIILITEQRN